MVTFGYTQVIDGGIERLPGLDTRQVSPELREAVARYFKVGSDDLRVRGAGAHTGRRIDDLPMGAVDEASGRVPDTAKLINEARARKFLPPKCASLQS